MHIDSISPHMHLKQASPAGDSMWPACAHGQHACNNAPSLIACTTHIRTPARAPAGCCCCQGINTTWSAAVAKAPGQVLPQGAYTSMYIHTAAMYTPCCPCLLTPRLVPRLRGLCMRMRRQEPQTHLWSPSTLHETNHATHGLCLRMRLTRPTASLGSGGATLHKPHQLPRCR
jgi:hypothetical protein